MTTRTYIRQYPDGTMTHYQRTRDPKTGRNIRQTRTNNDVNQPTDSDQRDNLWANILPSNDVVA